MQNDFDPLFEVLRDQVGVKQPAVEEPVETGFFTGADRDLLASLLQKAIRRGDLAVATQAARELLHVDKGRLWRRLMVTALEDIGIGDVDAAVLLISAATNARWRKCLGGDARILGHLLPLACKAIKERSADHIWSIVRHEPAIDLEYCALNGASYAALLAMLAMPSLPFLYRIRAALILAGRYSLQGGLIRRGKSDTAAVFGLFHEMEVPPLLVEACRIYAGRSSDGLCFISPLIWSWWQSEGACQAQTAHQLPSAGVVDQIPLYAMDPLHTRFGREAVKRWVNGLGERCRWDAGQLAIALWNFESAACDRTLFWKSGESLRDQAQRADLLARHVPLDQHDAIGAFIVSEYETLNAVRRTVLCKAMTPPGERAPVSASLIIPPPPQSPLRKETPDMPSKEVLHLEVGRYRLLGEKLKVDFTAIDDETLADTLEGISDLPEMIEAIVRSSLEDECLIEALKLRLETMNARLSRFKERFDKKRQLACWAMGSAGINKIEIIDFSVSFCEGNQKAEIQDAARLPEVYLIPVAPKIDRASLLNALKRGDVIEGASLIKGEAYITVRAR